MGLPIGNLRTHNVFAGQPGSLALVKGNTEYVAKTLLEVYQRLCINVHIPKKANLHFLIGIQSKKMQDCFDTKRT